MLGNLLKNVFGSKNERDLKKIQPLVDTINGLEPDFEKLTDSELRGKTPIFRERLDKGEGIDDLLPEAFAAVREASRRTLDMRHFDCQLVGGIVLHQGRIAEMKTGEGKTLAATLPAYLNALTGEGVHIVTVNDYLATRDTQWMGKIYNFMGMSVGTIFHGLDDMQRRNAYAADITYGTNNEFGFDYLRDNMKFSADELVQRQLNFAIVDEVDSILIDEARTPLIISGPAEKSTGLYSQVNKIIPRLTRDVDYAVDEKLRTAVLTEAGVASAENLLKIENLYDPKNIDLLHHINQALKAHTLFKRDVDYLVKSGQVLIVDEFTGRLMPGRRYSEGLHQALEAKEKVKIENENQTLATITFQNYFRMFNKLGGMTGTADTEAVEFKKIYDLDVTVIPTNQNMVRHDYPDAVYRSKKEKYAAVVKEIKHLYKKGQPVLVGTISVDISEELSKTLSKARVPHNVLNAKNHKKEAEIIAAAGQRKAVTISTNMAGRGTDIVLGEGVAEIGGLHVLGTERHDSRRIDNQLRGRSGRQGDAGSSRFYLALDDELLRLFGGERITGLMGRIGMEEGVPIEHNMLSKAIENAQRKREGVNFNVRKQLLEFDDVMNQQREVIYKQRRQALMGSDLKPEIESMIEEITLGVAENFHDDKTGLEELNTEALNDYIFSIFDFRLSNADLKDVRDKEMLAEIIGKRALAIYEKKERDIGAQEMRGLESFIMLQNVDSLWKSHLLSMDHLQEGIGLRGYAQQNPLIVYKKEGFMMFSSMISKIMEDTVRDIFKVQIVTPDDELRMLQHDDAPGLSYSHGGSGSLSADPLREPNAHGPGKGDGKNGTKAASGKRGKGGKSGGRGGAVKVGRNAPCPCGSGKKYKKCCGAVKGDLNG